MYIITDVKGRLDPVARDRAAPKMKGDCPSLGPQAPEMTPGKASSDAVGSSTEKQPSYLDDFSISQLRKFFEILDRWDKGGRNSGGGSGNGAISSGRAA